MVSMYSENPQKNPEKLCARSLRGFTKVRFETVKLIMYIYHALINALSAHMIHINLNVIFYTHVEHSPTKTIT